MIDLNVAGHPLLPSSNTVKTNKEVDCEVAKSLKAAAVEAYILYI